MAGTKQKSAKGGAPISSHPAFPAIVGLWFAALFGIGSLVLPTGFFETVVVAIGLDAVLPAAAPPLGFTARAAIAVAAAALGLALGLFLARKVVAAQANSQERSRDLKLKEEDRHPDAPAKRPISARKELGSEGLGPVTDPWKFEDEWADDDDDYDVVIDDADDNIDDDDADDDFHVEDRDVAAETAADPAPVAGHVAGRRRALSVTDDSGPSDFLMNAPLPGQNPDGPLELDVLELEPIAEDVTEDVPEDDAARNDFAQDIEALRNDDAPAAFTSNPETAAKPTHEEFAPREEEHSMTPSDLEPANAAAFSSGVAPSDRALSDLGMAELVERFASALQAKAIRDEDAAKAKPQSYPAVTVDTGANPFADRAAELDPDGQGFAGARPFAAPPVAQAQAPVPQAGLETEPAQETAEFDTPAPAETEAPMPMVFRPAGSLHAGEADDDNAASHSPFGKPDAVPSALQPVGFDDDSEDDEDADLPLSINFAAHRDFAPPAAGDDTGSVPFAQPSPFSAPESVELDEEEEDNDAYSSLLSMKSRLSGQEFARVDETEDDFGDAPEPVVTFPGQDSADAQTTPPSPAAQPSAGQDAARPFDAPQAPPSSQPVPSARQSPADASETERALREALEKLQRMSGAA
ncbi:hypothetical protein [Altererythrobacter sp. MTPC7]|uniref:hypothetical protein n=1 Tax=Altererythrobacter sp. MTPC7 TaxID=3056567 RepID=UPI0036F1CC89